ncbi:thiamine pyrophosphokinase [Candidatus Vecturithrix granuli]|uniref:Thiamine diphosphokinase n=1 Tax=Vecturithrix granuli TaxID=1499967 RepID=A0A081C9S4_VECG1|nr:thiamine pyrophosphokinase [Candidatus Vecturithrix granuli]
MRVVIFVNGEFHEPQRVRDVLQPEDYIIAVNGGTRHALSIGVLPQAIIGDLDSFTPKEQARIHPDKTMILRFPARKDKTDLELALRHALDKNATTILLLAALGGRLDQSMGNVFLLTLPELHGIDVKILEGRHTAFLIRDHAEITGQPGDTVSILPIGGDAVGVANHGLEWPLHDATLPLGSTRGISNVMLEGRASISVQTGMLLCVVTHL